jgi:ABC-2 type transport system permease protein
MTEGDGLPERTVLLSSSSKAWTLDSFDAQPNFTLHPDLGWRAEEVREAQPLAVAASGPFSSYFAGKDAPQLGEDVLSGGLIERSPDDARLVVLGSASFLSDPVIELSRSGNNRALAGLQLAINLVDWSLEDVELLAIRARSRGARTLRPTDVSTRQLLEWGNYGFALLAVFGIGLLSLTRRREASPMELDPPRTRDATTKGAA